MHYNVLADQYGSNLQPWFLYGADPPVSAAQRKELTRCYYQAGAGWDPGWPHWAEGVLSCEQLAAIAAVDQEVFAWSQRCERLWERVKLSNADVITLSECDHYEDFWRIRLKQEGYDSVWRKRPRDRNNDGCAIAWRASLFDMVAKDGVDFGVDRETTRDECDRSCQFALLRWRREPSCTILVGTTHLARNPENPKQVWTRGFQYGYIFRKLLEFATVHRAEEAPVLLTGDLNAKDVDELSGMVRVQAMISHPTHPLFWSVVDAPSPPTTRTDARNYKIDYLLYQSSCIRLTRVEKLPQLLGSIPDRTHPSDHLPIIASLALKSEWDGVKESATQWISAVTGSNTVRPLSGDALRDAYSYFDKDGSGSVSVLELETGLQTLGFFGVNGAGLAQLVKPARKWRSVVSDPGAEALGFGGRVGSGPGSGGGGGGGGCGGDIFTTPASWEMTLRDFTRAYQRGMLTAAPSSVFGRQLLMAFQLFDLDGDGVVTPSELRASLDRISDTPLNDERVERLIQALDQNKDGMISLSDFTTWAQKTYRRVLFDPELAPDAMWKVERLDPCLGLLTKTASAEGGV